MLLVPRQQYHKYCYRGGPCRVQATIIYALLFMHKHAQICSDT